MFPALKRHVSLLLQSQKRVINCTKVAFSVSKVAGVVVAGAARRPTGTKWCYATHDRPDRQFLCRPGYFKLLPKLIYSPSRLIGRRRAVCQERDWLRAAVRLKALCTTLLTGRFVRTAVAGQTEGKNKSVASFFPFFVCKTKAEQMLKLEHAERERHCWTDSFSRL